MRIRALLICLGSLLIATRTLSADLMPLASTYQAIACQCLSARALGNPYDHSQRSDSLSHLPEVAQRLLLKKAGGIFCRLTGRCPVAHRAGGYQADATTLSILADMGFLLDSSFNPCYQGVGSFDCETLLPNVPKLIQGIWEIPVTVAVQNLPDPRKPTRFMPFEVNAISLPEMRHILDYSHRTGIEHVVVMLHSFSGVKAKDVQYSRMKPATTVRRRFSGLLDYLAHNGDRFSVSTFDVLATRLEGLHEAPLTAAPELGYLQPLCRLAVQATTRWPWL